jgi:sarcosine oxidase gamma subunit
MTRRESASLPDDKATHHGGSWDLTKDLVAPTGAGVLLQNRPFLPKFLVRTVGDGRELAGTVSALAGVDVELGRAVRGPVWTALRWTPEACLLVAATHTPTEMLAAGYRPEAGALIVDQGAAYHVVRVAGPAARDLIAGAAFIDVTPPAFDLDHVAACRLGPYDVVLHQVEAPPAYDLYVKRSVAAPFLGYLAGIGYSHRTARLEDDVTAS